MVKNWKCLNHEVNLFCQDAMSVNPTTVCKAFCSLFKFLIKNYHLFYLLLLVSVFYVSVLYLTNVFIHRFEWVLKDISVLWYCYWILSPFSFFLQKILCQSKTKHAVSDIPISEVWLPFMPTQQEFSEMNVALTLRCKLDLIVVEVLR